MNEQSKHAVGRAHEAIADLLDATGASQRATQAWRKAHGRLRDASSELVDVTINLVDRIAELEATLAAERGDPVALPSRDPLVDPEPGDVVRATDKTAGKRPAVLTVCATENNRVVFLRASFYDGGFVYCKDVETLDEWRDWSAWTDVAVPS